MSRRLLPLLLAAALNAQLPSAQDLPVFRAETSLALVHFHVVQKKLYVDNLKAEDVELLEDGQPQKIGLFEGGLTARRTVPVELVLLFDTSGSVVEPGLLDPLSIKKDLFEAIPGASISVYRFEGRMRRLTEATRDIEQIRQAFAALDKRNPAGKVFPLEQNASPKDRKHGIGGSPIYEALMEALREAASGPSNTTRQLLIFSDGFPTTNTKPETAAAVARETGIPVYSVALGHQRLVERLKDAASRNFDRQGRPKEPTEQIHRLQMQEEEIANFARLGELTGGRSFDPGELNGDTLRRIVQFMVGQIRNEYVVGYYPQPGAGGKKPRRLEVRLRSKDLGKLYGGTRTLAR